MVGLGQYYHPPPFTALPNPDIVEILLTNLALTLFLHISSSRSKDKQKRLIDDDRVSLSKEILHLYSQLAPYF